MSVISSFTVTPNRILITFEYLNSLGEIGEKRKHLENQIHVGRDKTIVNEVLSEMKNLNLTESDQGKVKLKKELLIVIIFILIIFLYLFYNFVATLL